MTNPETEFTATLAERTIVVSWPDNERGGAVLPPDNWQERAWEERTLHEIDEGSISGCSVLRWRDDPRTDAELLAVSLALVTGKPAAVSVPPPAPQAADRRARYAAAIAEGFRAFDADTTSDAYLDAELLDAVVAAADAEEAELLAAVPVVPPAPRADDQAAVLEDRDSYHRWLKEAETARDEARLQLSRVIGERNRLAAEVDNLLQQEADRIVAHCPDHGTADGAWMDCHCAVADDMRRNAVGPCVAGEQQNETPEAAPCDVPNGCEDGDLCATHEEQQAHAEGEHEFCGVTCEVAMPTELMRNSLIAWAPPGGKGILAELERRAAAATAVVAQPGKEN